MQTGIHINMTLREVIAKYEGLEPLIITSEWSSEQKNIILAELWEVAKKEAEND